MLFRKRKRHNPGLDGGGTAAPGTPQSYFVGPDDLLKGNDVPRGRKKVRQFAVLVDSRVRVVTTGDVVDRATYEALLAAEAIAPPEPPKPPEPVDTPEE